MFLFMGLSRPIPPDERRVDLLRVLLRGLPGVCHRRASVPVACSPRPLGSSIPTTCCHVENRRARDAAANYHPSAGHHGVDQQRLARLVRFIPAILILIWLYGSFFSPSQSIGAACFMRSLFPACYQRFYMRMITVRATGNVLRLRPS